MTLADAKAHAFVADLEHPELDPGDRHHLERVLRLRPGETVTVSDGAGGWRACAFGSSLEPLGDVVRVPRPEPTITVGFAPTKGERPEWVVQKLTELGVDRIVPVGTARSVVRWTGARADRQRERLAVIAREAAMQSRQVWLPEVAPLVAFAEIAAGERVGLCERDGNAPSLVTTTLLVGPEGGWAPEERDAPLPRVCLPGGVLRAETAAVVAGAILCGLRAEILRPTL